MKVCRAKRGRLLAMVFVLLIPISCGQDPLPDVPAVPDMPDVPAFADLGFADSFAVVQEQVLAAYQRWQEQPLNAHRNGRLGMLLSAYAKNSASEILYRRARTLEPGEFRWIYYHAYSLKQLGRPDEAIAGFREALDIYPDRVSTRLLLAELLLQTHKLQESRELYQSITVELPQRVEGWLGLGKVLERMGDLDAAVAALQRASRVGPQYGEVHYALALLLRETGDEEAAARAISAYERTAGNRVRIQDPLMGDVIRLSAADGPHMKRAGYQLQRGQYAQAAKSFRAALAIYPDNQDAWGGLVDSLARLDRVDETGEAYRAALEAGISYRRLHLAYGQALLGWGQFDAAADIIGKAIELDPQYTDALSAMGELELQRGASAAAVEQFRRAIASAPHQPRLKLSLAQALNAAGQFEEAAGQLEPLAADPDLDRALALKELAVAYYGMKRESEAIDTLQRGREAARKSHNAAMVDSMDAQLAEWQQDKT